MQRGPSSQAEQAHYMLAPVSRAAEFARITESLGSSVRCSTGSAVLSEGDALELVKRIPDQSVSLILTDPPYHSTKKKTIHGDTAFAADEHYLDWLAAFANEWKRVLRPNGSLFCFCAPEMSARLEVRLAHKFNILAQVVWTKPNDPGFDGWKQKMKKEALRQWYPHTERIIFGEPASEGNLFRSPLATFLREARLRSGLTMHQLAEQVGAYGRVNHGGAISNWEAGRNTPSADQYRRICAALVGTGRIQSMPAYEDVVRPFEMDANREFTDVWNFPSVRPYPGKHPAEKPMALLQHAIEATTYAGDIVLDCFGGSGNTAAAALATGRRAIVMELDPKWVSTIAARLQIEYPAMKSSGNGSSDYKRSAGEDVDQLPLMRI